MAGSMPFSYIILCYWVTEISTELLPMILSCVTLCDRVIYRGREREKLMSRFMILGHVRFTCRNWATTSRYYIVCMNIELNTFTARENQKQVREREREMKRE